MFFFLLTVIPLVLLKPTTLWPLPVPCLMNEIKLLAFLLCKEFFHFSLQWLKTTTISLISILKLLLHQMPARKKLVTVTAAKQENAGGDHRTIYSPVLLDLPELALETVLQRLPPSGLYSMSAVCRSLRERCTSDHLWERHMEEKWGRVLGDAARREWRCYVAASRRWDCSSSPAVSSSSSTEGKVPGWAGMLLSCVWPLSWLARSSKNNGRSDNSKTIQLAPDSLMSWFLELESGRFWFPAQVYNRENGHIGFLLSCYDAQVSYDNLTDTFHARYLPHGRRATIIEDGISWDRLRIPPVATPPHNLHISDCLGDLQPRDHVEIQWRRTKEFPYGWWYGVVGHLESCERTEHTCNCHKSDTVIIEFRQYAPGSQWRHATVCRKDHQEQGNETDGFYGGIRKIKNKDEISGWRKFFPPEMLE